MPTTWAKWAASVPPDFRFAVKVPKTITHLAKLVDSEALATDFVRQVEPLGAKLAVLLVQLPPKLSFDARTADLFFGSLRNLSNADIACEPRNATWFDEEADELMIRHRVSRVAADPSLSHAAATPGGWRGMTYWRLHGSPAMYRSSYEEAALGSYARHIRADIEQKRNVWCIFDNTAASAATGDALSLMAKVNE